MLTHAELKAILPYRYPMLLIDMVVSVDRNHIIARKNITGAESCYSDLDTQADHSYPVSLIIESCCQAGGVILYKNYVKKSEGDLGGLLASIKNFEFYGSAFPGDTLEHRMKLERIFEKEIFFSGEVWVGDKRLACVELVMGGVRFSEYN